MPNSLDNTGLQIQTVAEIKDEIMNGTADFPGMYQLYGTDINVDPNSPDGQMVNIVAQAKEDVLQMLQQVYASFDPDQAIGVALDQRCAINGVFRAEGKYTYQPVDVTVTQALTLDGLDTAPNAPFTVSDGVGKQWLLASAYSFSGAGTHTLSFRAANFGAITSALNTITNIVTVQLGVASVNNSAAAATVGVAEETDYQLRILRAQSLSIASIGFAEGLHASLLARIGVTDALVLENITNSTDAKGIPAHSIWCIVAGGDDYNVAYPIYIKRNAGCGMKGSVTYTIDQYDGTTFDVKFDRPTPQNLWISFNVAAITGSIDANYVRTQILAQLFYGINKPADTASIVSLIKSLAPNASVSSEGVSIDNVTYSSLLSPSTVDKQFAIASTRIIINGVAGT